MTRDGCAIGRMQRCVLYITLAGGLAVVGGPYGSWVGLVIQTALNALAMWSVTEIVIWAASLVWTRNRSR